MSTTMKKGDTFIAYPDERPCHRVFVTVTRVARDGTWADIQCQTWAVMWTKRQKLVDGRLPGGAIPGTWDDATLHAQMEDHSDWLEEQEANRA